MKDIYQQIWDADQNQNGIQAILASREGDPQRGYVKVSENLDTKNRKLKVLPALVLPESKQATYKLALKLFDNYALPEKDRESDSAEKRTEVHNFVETIMDTAPMQVAREYIALKTGSSLSRQRWYNTLMEMWFRKFSMGGDPDLSGFEHVIVGEQEGAKVQGYHFWYKYYLDDGFAKESDGAYSDAFPALNNDRINYFGSRLKDGQEFYPESVTLAFQWFAPDYDRQSLRPLFKPIGGFFVGCSIEGLLAIGTVRGHLGINAPKKAVINGAEYELVIHHSPNFSHIRTFYPQFLRGVAVPTQPELTTAPPILQPEPITTPAVPGDIRIIAALINPKGKDQGKESITIINVGHQDISLSNWIFVDKHERKTNFSVELGAGETHRVILDGKGVQLSNSGGLIKLLNHKKEMVHLVSFSKAHSKPSGITQLF